MRNRYNFYVKAFRLYLQTRYDGWNTYMVWYKKQNGRPAVVAKSVMNEDYSKFITRVTKLKLFNV